jgi:hypothetical protein
MSWKPLENIILDGWKKTIQEWKSFADPRERRVHPILRDSFFGMTWRGKGVDTSADLRNLSLADLSKSAYWKAHVPADLEDDEAVEAFWDTHFSKSDIPDEWSLKDQEKSHGRGCSMPLNTPLIRWWTLWIPPQKKLISEEQEKKVLVYLKQEPIGSAASILDKWITRTSLVL